MDKTYADECLERAENATKGPWDQIGGGIDSVRVTTDDGIVVIRNTNKPFEDGQFIAHARTDVPELAKRLKRAIAYLQKDLDMISFEHLIDDDEYCDFLDFINELKAPLEKK